MRTIASAENRGDIALLAMEKVKTDQKLKSGGPARNNYDDDSQPWYFSSRAQY